MNRLCITALGTVLLAGGLTAQADGLAYDNLQTSLNTYLGGFGPYGEAADDITLASTGIFKNAKVAYDGVGFDGDETLTLNLYAMDGAPTPGSFGFNTPGTLLFTQTVSLDGSGFADFSDPTLSLTLPGYLAVGLVFDGVDFDPTTSDAGPSLYDPPVSPGDSFYDYYLKGFAGDPDWALYDFGGNPPVNFGVQIGIIPEPGTWVAMIGFGTIAGSMAFRRIRGSK
jgi:hypothetical protein